MHKMIELAQAELLDGCRGCLDMAADGELALLLI
jgi:hypothetical protein